MHKKVSIQYFKTDLGELILGSYQQKLCLCDWRYRKNREKIDQRISQYLGTTFVEEGSEVINQAKTQLQQFFIKERESFDLDILLVGTDFQKLIWNELSGIPYGKTVSYLELSQRIDNTKAIRAVASANGANALSIIIPCHRVVGSNGELTGYAGGITTKRKLLQLEQIDQQLELF